MRCPYCKNWMTKKWRLFRKLWHCDNCNADFTEAEISEIENELEENEE